MSKPKPHRLDQRKHPRDPVTGQYTPHTPDSVLLAMAARLARGESR